MDVGAIKARNLALEGYCETEGCGHFYVFDIDRLIEEAGVDYLVPEFLAGLSTGRPQATAHDLECAAGARAARRPLTLLS